MPTNTMGAVASEHSHSASSAPGADLNHDAIYEAVCDLEGIGKILIDMAGSAERGEIANSRALYFIATSILNIQKALKTAIDLDGKPAIGRVEA